LCPTRWSVRVRAIEGVLNTYEAVVEWMEELSGANEKVSPKASGLLAQLTKCEFYIGLQMASKLFSLGESLSRVLQSPNATIAGGIQAATYTVNGLLEMKTEKCFNELWEAMLQKSQEYSLNEPTLPRLRKKPKRFNDDADPPTFASPKEWLKSLFHQAIENICEEIGRRFDQPGLSMYDNLETGILKSPAGISNELTTACNFYCLDHEKVLSEVSVLSNGKDLKWTSTKDIVDSLKSLTPEMLTVFPTLNIYLKHLLVVPCSSAGAERSFSWLRRIKSYLRSTMGQARLNYCALINCYANDLVDELNLNVVMQEFITMNNREATFGKFSSV